MTDPSIRDYGFLSDCQTAALVSRDGSIDWYCPHRFDGEAVFARLLDPDVGHWLIRPVDQAVAERNYITDTMVLETRFKTDGGEAALTDALALGEGTRGHQIGLNVPHVLLRRVSGLAGTVEFEMEFVPRPEFGLTFPLIQAQNYGVSVMAGALEMALIADCPIEIVAAGAVARFRVRARESVHFALVYRRYPEPLPEDPRMDVSSVLDDTIAGWQSWSEMHRAYDGPYQELVYRSALVLQALTYQPSGAVIAAATTSLPEIIGGSWNWDYRFVWLRDLSLTLRALWIAACPDEVERFFDWVIRALGNLAVDEQTLQIMYSVDARRDLSEHTLDHLRGYADSVPVRIGNAAWRQMQIDVMGEVIDSIYLFRERLGDLSETLSDMIVLLVERTIASWEEPDAGMWEARDRERHYLSSKLMCWVAVDRAIKLAPRLHGDVPLQMWKDERERMRQTILNEGWHDEAKAYTGAFGSDRLDASVLLMALVDFLPATDERMQSTIEAIERQLSSDGLVHRWASEENGFLICSFWLVEALARAGERDRAAALFEKITAHANDLGLMSEMVDPKTGALVGNFPQAFSHIGLINAAYAISQADG